MVEQMKTDAPAGSSIMGKYYASKITELREVRSPCRLFL